jgi:tetratricopeptide (TPR) repeat protein
MAPDPKNRRLKSESRILPPGRRFLFISIAVLLPFCLLIFLEVVLRIAGYGNDYPLFTEDLRNPDFLKINDEIARRYFLNPEAAPNVSSPSFRKEKNEKTLRIVVQGASTALGVPYMHGGSFPAMLEQRLRLTCPDKEIEVINTAITAVNTYTLLDLADEITEIEPDAIIIYTGQNEYYGALGVGSTQQFSSIQGLVYLYMVLDDLRLFSLIKNLQTGIARKKSADILLNPDKTLMERMVREQSIPYGSKMYFAGIRQFKRNISKLIKIYHRKNIPVLIGTTVSNLRDIRPFISSGTNVVSQLNQEYTEEKEYILHLIEEEEDNASAHYRAGQLFYAEKDYLQAESMFRKAKDLDLLRFRAPEAFNEILRENADKWDFILVDLDSVFSFHSENGIIGNELITEHVHPNAKGYFLMADAFYSELLDNKIPESDYRISFAEAFKQMPVTRIDSVYAQLGLTVLTNSWPFKNDKFDRNLLEVLFAPFSYPDSLALLVFREELTWTQAMNELYRYCLEHKHYEGALRVTEAMKTEYRYTGIPYNMSARVFGLQQQIGKAIKELKYGFRLDSLPEIAYNLSGYYLDTDNLQESLYYLEYAVDHNPGFEGAGKKLVILRSANTLKGRLQSDPANVSLMINLAKNYVMLNQLERADSLIRLAIQTNPSHPEVKSILKKVTGS